MHSEVPFLLSGMLYFWSVREGSLHQFAASKRVVWAGGGRRQRARGGAGAGLPVG